MCEFNSSILYMTGYHGYILTCGEAFMMLGWTSDPFVCVSVLLSALFSIWAVLTALASFFATGGCEIQTAQ